MRILNLKGWKELGFVPKDGEKPNDTKLHRGAFRYVEYLFREDQVRPIRKAKAIETATWDSFTMDDVFAATWTVNRSAKRYRDAASANYAQRQHGFAGCAKETKEELYRLKDRGLRYLIGLGEIAPVKKHGSLTLWRGRGYSFHSPMFRPGVELIDDGPVEIEAKPKGKGEMRLKDAKALLLKIDPWPIDVLGLSISSPPVREREVVRHYNGFDDDCEDE